MARSSKSDSGGIVFKTGIFALLAGIAFWIFNRSSSGEARPDVVLDTRPSATTKPSTPPEAAPTDPEYLPASTTGEVVRHHYFTLSYHEDHEQAEWVAYELTRQRLDQNWVERTGAIFKPDPLVRTESATPRDYAGSGYDRGHLCPAADMAFDTLAMNETFFMSNMSPQVRGFNAGIWREVEELTRDWARRFGRIYVVTGPMLSRTGVKQIGFSKVTVPVGFYKVLYAPDQHRAIGFVIPNQVSERPVMEYAFDIDYVEKMTGLDFFPKLLSGLNAELEGSLDKSAWPVSQKRYELRVREWNE
jgi:endonuclease G, mitochondrial